MIVSDVLNWQNDYIPARKIVSPGGIICICEMILQFVAIRAEAYTDSYGLFHYSSIEDINEQLKGSAFEN